jgi:hypothetical protein
MTVQILQFPNVPRIGRPITCGRGELVQFPLSNPRTAKLTEADKTSVAELVRLADIYRETKELFGETDSFLKVIEGDQRQALAHASPEAIAEFNRRVGM